MTVQEAVKKAIKSAGLTQADVAERCGFSGQGAVSMYLRSKSMRVESLAMMLKACGYDLVARSKSPGVRYPEIVIEAEGDVTVPDCEAVQQEMVMGADEEVDEILKKTLDYKK